MKLWILWLLIPIIWGNHSGNFTPGWVNSWAFDTKIECEQRIIDVYAGKLPFSAALQTSLMKCLREDHAPPGPVSEPIE